MASYKLSEKELAKLNRGLAELEDIKDDLERARIAGVPNMEHLDNACEQCKDNIVRLKEAYAKGKK